MAEQPVVVVCVGMAGSGKTTFMQRINAYLHTKREPPYIINLDPAVNTVPFETNIDIRDSINYREVMSQYNLGPNGGILTSLNLFATKVDQILAILEKRTGVSPDPLIAAQQPKSEASTEAKPSHKIRHILADTPGQIEVFVWSASGQILLSSLASTFPTVLAYIIDTPRTASTSTFMSNMLYACSILYKTKLPMILVFNKTDVQSAEFAKEWMTDFDAFQAALRQEAETGVAAGSDSGMRSSSAGGTGYINTLLNSMSLVLEEFYRHLSVVSVSSLTGAGCDEFFVAVQEKAKEFERDYRPELQRKLAQREKQRLETREKEMGKLMKDLDVEDKSKPMRSRRSRNDKEEPDTVSEAEEAREDEEEEAELTDPDSSNEAEDEEEANANFPERFRRAMAQDPSANPTGDDFSFAKYLHSSRLD